MSSACLVAVVFMAFALVNGGAPRPGGYCRHGVAAGYCGVYNRFQCPGGSYCKMIMYHGVCCNKSPVQGVCPPSSGPGPCVFDPERNCLSHSQCPEEYLCCSEGCGKVCKHQKTGTIYTGRLMTNIM